MFRAHFVGRLPWAVVMIVPVGCFDDNGAPSTSGTSGSGTTQGSYGSGGPSTGGDPGTATSVTGSTEAGTVSGSTGGPDGCGDGEVDPGEECDDGNRDPGDACHSDCTLYKLVFVSTSSGTGKLDGLDGADLLCNTDAAAAGLEGTFKAWLSTSDEAPSTRFTPAQVPYRRPDGIMIAKDWDDLVDGTLAAPINLDLDGVSYPDAKIWTGTLPNGTAAGDNCSNWTTTGDAFLTGVVGSTKQAGSEWTNQGLRFCTEPTRVYCFQQ